MADDYDCLAGAMKGEVTKKRRVKRKKLLKVKQRSKKPRS